MPPLPTGLSTADAQDDFLRARRRQAVSRLARFLSRERGDIDVILPFDEVVGALGATSRTSIVVFAVLLVVFGAQRLPWKSTVAVIVGGAVLAAAAWASSPYLRSRRARRRRR